jgi:hypothetical protein
LADNQVIESDEWFGRAHVERACGAALSVGKPAGDHSRVILGPQQTWCE